MIYCLQERGDPYLKNSKRTALFIGIFLAVILLSFVIYRVARRNDAPPSEPTTIAETTTELESTSEAESTADLLTRINETTTHSAPPATTRYIATTSRSIIPVPRTTATAIPRTSAITRQSTTIAAHHTTTRHSTTNFSTATTQKPVTTTKTTASFDTQDLLAYGIGYGKSIGLTYRPQLTQGGEAIYSAVQAQIKAKLDQAKAGGATEFNLWREQNNGTQVLYIIMKR